MLNSALRRITTNGQFQIQEGRITGKVMLGSGIIFGSEAILGAGLVEGNTRFTVSAGFGYEARCDTEVDGNYKG